MRFTPANSAEVLLGEPVDSTLDVGLATFEGRAVDVEVYGGKTILNAGGKTGRIERVGELLSPLSEDEVGSIRCIGLNVSSPSVCGGREANGASAVCKARQGGEPRAAYRDRKSVV